MGQGQMQTKPHQGAVQYAAADAENSEEVLADLEAAAMQNLPNMAADGLGCYVGPDKSNVKKLTRTQKSKLVDQVLKVHCQDSNKIITPSLVHRPCFIHKFLLLKLCGHGDSHDYGMISVTSKQCSLCYRAEMLTQRPFLPASKHAWTGASPTSC